MQNLSKPGRWWHWLPARLSLRALMILVLIMGGALGWIVRSAQVQREAVAAIQKAGGRVWYEPWDYKNGRPIRGGKPWWPKWLVGLVGVDYFGTVRLVLHRGKGSDGELAQIGRLTGLRELNLSLTSVSDAGLAHLKRLTGLTWMQLDLQESAVTDAGLAHIRKVPGIQQLDLTGTMVSDAGLAQLRGLTGLQDLILNGTKVTGAGMTHLSGLTGLRCLSLRDSAVNDTGLKHLEGLVGLKELDLGGTSVSDSGVRQLQRAISKVTVRR